MKKWLIWTSVAVIIIVIITALLPLAMGMAVEKKYSQVLETWSREENIKLKLVSYKRGWFNSDAVVQVDLSYPTLMEIKKWLGNENPGAIPLTLNQHIEHGPFLWVSPQEAKDRFLLGRAVIKSTIKTALGLIDTITFAELDGSLLTAINAPNLHLNNQGKGITAQLTSLTATLLLSPNMNQIFASIESPTGNITTPEFLQQITNLSEQFSLRKTPSGLFLGWRTTKIGNVSWETIDHSSRIQLDGLTMQSQSAEQSAKMSYRLNAILNKIVFDNGSYGPHQIKLIINQLDVPTLLAIRKELTQITSAEALSTTQLLLYNDLFMMLVSKGLDFNIDKLNLVMPSGIFAATIQLKLTPQSAMATNLKTFLDYLEATAHLKIPAPMLSGLISYFNQSAVGRLLGITATDNLANTPTAVEQHANQQIKKWVQNKWLTPEDDSYQSEISYKNKQLMANGVPVTQEAAVLPPLQH